MKRKPPKMIRVLGRFYHTETEAIFNPKNTGVCWFCDRKGLALEPVSLLCETCADRVIRDKCRRCGNYESREDMRCSCHERLTREARYWGEAKYRHSPLFQDSQGQFYTIGIDPRSTLELAVRLANAGLIPAYKTDVVGVNREKVEGVLFIRSAV